MEISYYGFVVVLGILFSINDRPIANTRLFFVIWLGIYIGLSIIVRGEFDSDIEVYASAMTSSSMAVYYLKEPVVWLGQRYLFNYLQDPYAVFVIFDIVAGVILFNALKMLRVPQYAYFAVLLFFPFILGMQNVYRQWVASILLLSSFSLIWKGKSDLKAYAFFAASVLAHNVAAVFMPLLFINKGRATGKSVWVLSFGISFAGIYFGSETKSSAHTGANLSYAYLMLLLLFLCLVAILDKGVIRKERKVEYKLIVGLTVLSSLGTAILSSAASERISMLCLLVLYPVLSVFFEERIKQRVPLRISFMILGFIPILFFQTSHFILG